jgi:hypothetical protein
MIIFDYDSQIGSANKSPSLNENTVETHHPAEVVSALTSSLILSPPLITSREKGIAHAMECSPSSQLNVSGHSTKTTTASLVPPIPSRASTLEPLEHCP